MIQSISLGTVNRMSRDKLLFGDGTCELCGSDEPTHNVGGINACPTCWSNRTDNKWPVDEWDADDCEEC